MPYAANMNHGGTANTMTSNTVAHNAPAATIYPFMILRVGFDNAKGIFFVFFGFFLYSV
jgi:hypothetical protein